MHLAIDAREAFAGARTGKGQWTSGLIEELRRRDVTLSLLADDRSSDQNVIRFPGGMRWHRSALEYLRSAADIDCYISPLSFIVPAFVAKDVPCIPVIHDLIAFQGGGGHQAKATFIERLLLPRVLRRSTQVCVVSESTKHDLLERFPHVMPSTITTVYAGPMRDTAPLSEPDGKTILCVATLCPRKNQLRLIRAYTSLPSPLRENHRLLLAGGRGWQDSEIIRMAKNTKGVEWVGYVSDAEYLAMLSTAKVFALPSLYEGFGMQILDALQRGVPVLTSDRGSLKEVTGDAAVLVDPESERSIAAGLTAILENDDIRSALRQKGPKKAAEFSWKRTADLVLEAVGKVL